jgi:N4-gp56 family major capsid protein
MTQHAYGTVTPRIGKLKGAMLKAAMPKEVLAIAGDNHRMGTNQSDTIVFRRWLPYGGATTNSTTINQWVVDENAHLTSEGVTPDADTLTAQDITVQLNQYSCLYMYTDKTADLYEDDVPTPMKKQAGERMGLVREMVRYGTLKGCTNAFYAGGTTRATVDETISLGLLRSVSRSLLGNRCSQITSVLAPSSNYNTTSIEAGFLVFCHTDMEHDIRELPGFVPCASYGQRKMVHECELGAVDRYRFIISPELSPIADAGVATASAPALVANSTNVDVYPMIVVAEDAWGDIALRGKDSFTPTHIPHTQRDKQDPLGQRGYVGSIFWCATFIQNDGWMATVECGATDL